MKRLFFAGVVVSSLVFAPATEARQECQNYPGGSWVCGDSNPDQYPWKTGNASGILNRSACAVEYHMELDPGRRYRTLVWFQWRNTNNFPVHIVWRTVVSKDNRLYEDDLAAGAVTDILHTSTDFMAQSVDCAKSIFSVESVQRR
jgi:hypothetical protein